MVYCNIHVMRKYPTCILMSLLMIATTLTGCLFGDEGSTIDDGDETPEPPTLGYWEVYYVSSGDDLPLCNSDTFGRLYYVESDDRFHACEMEGWEIIDLTGAGGMSATSCHLVPFGNCAGADLSGMDLSGMDLTGINLRSANLRGADLSGAELNESLLMLGHSDRVCYLLKEVYGKTACQFANRIKGIIVRRNIARIDLNGLPQLSCEHGKEYCIDRGGFRYRAGDRRASG